MTCVLVGMLCFAACSGAQFVVRVQDRQRQAVRDARVRLYDGASSPCSAGPIGGGGTSNQGEAVVSARWCGEGTLVTSAPGYLPDWQKVDTCEALAPTIILQPAPAEPAGATSPVAVTALKFFEAVRHRDLRVVRELLSDPTQTELYEGQGFAVLQGDCESSFEHTEIGASPHVELAFSCAGGCSEFWRVDLTQQNDSWRVRGLAPTGRSLPRLF